MKALMYRQFKETPVIVSIPEIHAEKYSAIIRVKAAGLCLSDWHAWQGHDSDIVLPHVPGHEFSGVIEEVGSGVTKWKVGDRVTTPFVSACGSCRECNRGEQQVCSNQTQPGFTHWGAFAEYVRVDFADTNLVELPDSMSFETAASLGCRFATAFRAVVSQGRVSAGDWVVVHGCGGVGLSAVMIASAIGASVIAVDIQESKLELAKKAGARDVINGLSEEDVVGAICEITKNSVKVSFDALGSEVTFLNSVNCLGSQGRHVQIGIIPPSKKVVLPSSLLIAKEIEIIGSRGMAAHCYPEMLRMIENGLLNPELLIDECISLEEAADALALMGKFKSDGIKIVNRF